MPPGLENHISSSRKVEDHKKIIVLSGLAEVTIFCLSSQAVFVYE